MFGAPAQVHLTHIAVYQTFHEKVNAKESNASNCVSLSPVVNPLRNISVYSDSGPQCQVF